MASFCRHLAHTDLHRRTLIKHSLAVTALILAANLLCLGGDFVLDDARDIVFHPVVGGDQALSSVLDYSYGGFPLGTGPNTIRPLVTSQFSVTWALFGAHPEVFDAITLLWLVCCGLFALAVLRRVLGPQAALPAALLFAGLAVHVDAVAVIANSADVISATLCMASLWAVLSANVLIAGALALTACLAKESAVAVIAMAPLLVAWQASRQSGQWRAVAAVVAACIGFVVWRFWLFAGAFAGTIAGLDNPLVDASWSGRLLVPLSLVGRYVALAVAPVNQAADYGYSVYTPRVDWSDGYMFLGAVVVALVVWGLSVAYRQREHQTARALGASLSCLVASYALISNTLFLNVTVFAERLFFLPSIWMCASVMAGLCHATRDADVPITGRRLFQVVWASWIVMQLILGTTRYPDYDSNLSLQVAQVQNQPSSVRGHVFVARNYETIGDSERALFHMALAVHARRRYPEAWSPPDIAIEDTGALAELIAPGVPPGAFWLRLSRLAEKELGPGAAELARRLAREP